MREYTDENGFRIEEDVFKGARRLVQVCGAGEAFCVPAGVVYINGIAPEYLSRESRCITFDTPNLRKVCIPASVVEIGPAAFDRFGAGLQIFCEAPEKPDGFFEGTYYEIYQEDYEFYKGAAYQGSWLTAGTLREKPREELPQVFWGVPLSQL